MATHSQPTIEIKRKHSLAIRWMHSINFPLLFTMIWSGILIIGQIPSPILATGSREHAESSKLKRDGGPWR